MILNDLPRNGGALVVVLCAMGLLSACTTSDEKAATAERLCPTPQDSIIGGAAVAYVSGAEPLAHRYVIPISTDSALPSSAYWGLQGRTTLHEMRRDSAGVQAMKTQLNKQATYVNLLLAFHGQRKLPDGRLAMDFSGTYFGGKNDGKTIPRKTVTFTCSGTGAARFAVADPSPPA
jgi:hypothetical protein